MLVALVKFGEHEVAGDVLDYERQYSREKTLTARPLTTALY